MLNAREHLRASSVRTETGGGAVSIHLSRLRFAVPPASSAAQSDLLVPDTHKASPLEAVPIEAEVRALHF